MSKRLGFTVTFREPRGYYRQIDPVITTIMKAVSLEQRVANNEAMFLVRLGGHWFEQGKYSHDCVVIGSGAVSYALIILPDLARANLKIRRLPISTNKDSCQHDSKLGNAT